MAGKNQLPLEMPERSTGDGIGDRLQEDKMSDMISRLHLTSEESEVLQVADDVEDGLATSDSAIIGKVLSQGVLHIQTIMAALRPAWGNPKGLVLKTVGHNLFIAEFGSKQDKDRVLDGSPWTVGKRAVLIQEFDASIRPTDILFDQMSIWVRIYNLPFGLMNRKWGYEIARMVGPVEKLEVDAQDRAWGAYLRAKVKINITKPLRRGVSIFSAKRQITEWYEVRYEKLPYYCYSYGVIGHSSVECPTPADRDENGLLPYNIDLRVPDDRKKKVIDEMGGKNSPSAGTNSGTATCRESILQGANLRFSNNHAHSTGSSEQQSVDLQDLNDDENIPPSFCKNTNGTISSSTTRDKLSKSSAKDLHQDKNLNLPDQGKKKEANAWFHSRCNECFVYRGSKFYSILGIGSSIASIN
jgi:hypothetical protein